MGLIEYIVACLQSCLCLQWTLKIRRGVHRQFPQLGRMRQDVAARVRPRLGARLPLGLSILQSLLRPLTDKTTSLITYGTAASRRYGTDLVTERA